MTSRAQAIISSPPPARRIVLKFSAHLPQSFRTWPAPHMASAAALLLLVLAGVAADALRPPVPPPHVTIDARGKPPVQVARTVPKPAPVKPVAKGPTVFQQEQAMTYGQLMRRWDPFIAEASKRFGVPISWVRAVMQIESGGRTMLAEGLPMTSTQGAMGLMQLMPETYDDMRRAYGLGHDPYDPHDNIIAGTAYLRFLRGKYGYPQMFAAYNDGPGNLEARLKSGNMLPMETQLYLVNVVSTVETGHRATGGLSVSLTRPDGSKVAIDAGSVTAVRAAFPDEYTPGVLSVVTIGKKKQGVREDVSFVRSAIRAHGGAI
jgi:soluble lytic murein transglycosylase-like protein